jgi:hypothetical protein
MHLKELLVANFKWHIIFFDNPIEYFEITISLVFSISLNKGSH